MLQLALFCSSSDDIDLRWKRDAQILGQWLGTHDVSLCYGGAPCGLMEATAQSMREAGNDRITAVITRPMAAMERLSRYATHHIVSEALADRKATMMQMSSLAVALPGGVGTFDEIFSWLAAAQIGEHTKELVLYNGDGFFDALLAQIATADAHHFSRSTHRALSVVTTINELTALLAQRAAL